MRNGNHGDAFGRRFQRSNVRHIVAACSTMQYLNESVVKQSVIVHVHERRSYAIGYPVD
jgi:hypothetical protein